MTVSGLSASVLPLKELRFKTAPVLELDAVVPQRHEAPPPGLGRREHDRRVGICGPDEQQNCVAV
jgi:hypothetical protein